MIRAFKNIGLISFCLILGCKNFERQIAETLVERATEGKGYEEMSIYKGEGCFAKSRVILGLENPDTRDYVLEKSKNYQYQSRVWLDSFEALGWRGKKVSITGFQKIDCQGQIKEMQCFQFHVGDQEQSLEVDLVLLKIDGQLFVQYLHWNLQTFDKIIKPLIDAKSLP